MDISKLYLKLFLYIFNYFHISVNLEPNLWLLRLLYTKSCVKFITEGLTLWLANVFIQII